MTRGNKRLLWIAASFFLVSTATRIGLAFYSGETYTAVQWLDFMAVGFIFDLVVVPCFLLPWAIYDAVLPRILTNHHVLSRWESRWAAFWGTAYLSLFVFTATSEFTFWTEFGSRFNFIAVDYLVYTHEVINNIWESYPITLLLSGIFGFCLVAVWLTWPHGVHMDRPKWPKRWSGAVVVGLALFVGMWAADQKYTKSDSNVYVQQLSNNGIFAFGHAFWHNQLDYKKFYPVVDEGVLDTKIRGLVQQPDTEFSAVTGIDREVRPRLPMRNVNVVLISVESLSASFMGIFGNDQNLTPELDQLAGEGLLFTNLYATGTRTVRGLEALSVGTPPTPGQSIVRRPNNDGLKTLGGELKTKGWQPYWVYGGYGFFDNMNAYFDGNHYTVVDRSNVDAEGITVHHENVWGIADEDLYSLAMAYMDREDEQSHRFFEHIMTTSNHRPYTFPEGHIGNDWPQKKRESAVRYTSWAIGDFIKRSAEKPWFKNTLFIITADHTSKASGKSDLPISRYHIPMIWYAPGLIQPGTMGRLMSQIDIPPTVLGWLGVGYDSRFFGYDIFSLEPGRERAFISTYQKLGYMKNGRLVVMDVNREPEVEEGLMLPRDGATLILDENLIQEAIAWYQSSSEYFTSGKLKEDYKTFGE